MTTYEIVAVIVSVFAFVVTLVNVVFYIKLTTKYNALVQEQNNISFEQNKISQGQAETQMRELIMGARQEVSICSEKLVNCILIDNEKDSQLQTVYQKMFDAAQEDLRNAYEEACSRYLEEKVDKKRFKRMYYSEIQSLVENKDQIEYFDSVKSRYKCILKVYKEWFDLEK